ncbi:MAG: hypothetical protein WB698_04430 [Solirubrobacteraceae bacterium]
MALFQAFPLLQGQIRAMGETLRRANQTLMVAPAVGVGWLA